MSLFFIFLSLFVVDYESFDSIFIALRLYSWFSLFQFYKTLKENLDKQKVSREFISIRKCRFFGLRLHLSEKQIAFLFPPNHGCHFHSNKFTLFSGVQFAHISSLLKLIIFDTRP